MEEKLVSIITPCYNGELYAERFFENILEQSYKNIELIFINDGSSDHTEEIAMKYKGKFEADHRKFIYIYQENAGQAAAVNKGLKVFTGEYLMWTDSDDLLSRDNVKEKVAFMELHPELGYAQCFGREVNEDDLETKVRDFRRIPPLHHDNFFEDLIMKQNVEYTPGIYIARSSTFLTINPDREIEESRVGQNFQMLLPLAYYSKGGYIEKELFTYVIRKESHSHGTGDLEKVMKRSQDINDIIISTLERAHIPEIKKYIDMLDEKVTRELFDAGFNYKDYNYFEQKYMELKNKGYKTKRDMLLYYSYKYKLLFSIFKFLKGLKATGKKIKFLIGKGV